MRIVRQWPLLLTLVAGCASSSESKVGTSSSNVNATPSATAASNPTQPLDGAPHFLHGNTRTGKAPSVNQVTPHHWMPESATPTPQALTSASSPLLTYRGGPILQKVEVYAVLWGTNVSSDVQAGIGGFFSALTKSPLQSMVNEYDVNGMSLGTGAFKGVISDADAPMPSSGFVTDEMVEAEVARLMDLHKAPGQDGKNIFFFYFPPGIVIDGGGGQLSCQYFCGYHSAFKRSGHAAYYAVIPDFTSGGCEYNCVDGAAIDSIYEVSSHELMEAITDPEVDSNATLAWYDDANWEIGDICAWTAGSSSGYRVQKQWSNAQNGCSDHATGKTGSLAIQYDPSAVIPSGGTTTYTVTASGTFDGPMTLSLGNRDFPALPPFTGITGTFNPPTISAGQSSTVTVSVPAFVPSQNTTISVSGTDADGVVHYSLVNMALKGAPPVATSADVSTGPSQGGTAVTITGTGFGPNAYGFMCPASGCTSTSAVPVYGGQLDPQRFFLYTPSFPAGPATIVVLNANDGATTSVPFTYTAGAAPTITQVRPSAGPIAGGTAVDVIGTNIGSNALVIFNGKALAQYQDYGWNGEAGLTIFATAAVPHPERASIVIQNADGQSVTDARAFRYGPNPPPYVDQLSVSTGPTTGGTYVTIFGSDFDAHPWVVIGGRLATVETVNPYFLGVITPPHSEGAVPVVVGNSDRTTVSYSSFTYTDGDADDAPASK